MELLKKVGCHGFWRLQKIRNLLFEEYNHILRCKINDLSIGFRLSYVILFSFCWFLLVLMACSTGLFYVTSNHLLSNLIIVLFGQVLWYVILPNLSWLMKILNRKTRWVNSSLSCWVTISILQFAVCSVSYPECSFNNGLFGTLVFNLLALFGISLTVEFSFFDHIEKSSSNEEDFSLKEQVKVSKIGDSKEETTVCQGLLETTNMVYVKSSQNYLDVFYLNEGQLSCKIVRCSLTKLMNQLDEHYFIRIHRSYIVNMNFVKVIKGNSKKAWLKINQLELELPVARGRRLEVLDKYQLIVSRKPNRQKFEISQMSA